LNWKATSKGRENCDENANYEWERKRGMLTATCIPDIRWWSTRCRRCKPRTSCNVRENHIPEYYVGAASQGLVAKLDSTIQDLGVCTEYNPTSTWLFFTSFWTIIPALTNRTRYLKSPLLLGRSCYKSRKAIIKLAAPRNLTGWVG